MFKDNMLSTKQTIKFNTRHYDKMVNNVL